MDYKLIAIIIAIVDFVLYVAYIWGRYGIQKSISISYYDLPAGSRVLFRVFIWILSLAVILSGIGWDNGLFFTSGAMLSLVGIFSNIKDKDKFVIHMIGAIGGIATCFCAIFYESAIVGIWTLVSAFVLLSIVFQFGNEKHLIWNAEVVSFSILITSILYLINQ